MVLRRLATISLLLMVLVPALVIGWVFVGGPLSVQADGPAHVSNDTLVAHGYSNASVEHIRVNDTFEYEGVSKRVNASLYMATAAKATANGEMSGLVTLTLPAWRVGGMVNLNPISYVPMGQILEYAAPHLPMEFKSFEKSGSTTVHIGGAERTVSEFQVTDAYGGTNRLYLAHTTLDSDLVIVIGMQSEGAGEGKVLLDLMASLDH